MECERCKNKIKGGFDPTGFSFPPCPHCFDRKMERINICRPCYELFWEKFKRLQENFIMEFFRG